MRVSARRSAIIEMIAQKKQITVEELALAFKSSRETIRRDLASLDAGGLIQKYHGGARLRAAPSRITATEARFKTRLSENNEAKRAIANAAATLFRDGDALFIDTGSTTVIFAEALSRLQNLTVITNSTAIAALLAGAERRHRVYLIGGEFAPDASETVGALAIEQIRRFNAQHAVLTAGAIQPSGILDFDIKETDIARAMIEQSKTVTVLADHSKFGKAGVFQVADIASIDSIVTDAEPPADFRDAFRGAGVNLVVAMETG